MSRQKLGRLAKEFNLAVTTVASFLRDNGIDVDDNPNTRVDEVAVQMLISKFSPDYGRERTHTTAPRPTETIEPSETAPTTNSRIDSFHSPHNIRTGGFLFTEKNKTIYAQNKNQHPCQGT